jgi:UDP-N-acetylglucosamine:LPS N-acetylglucosamine transferase
VGEPHHQAERTADGAALVGGGVGLRFSLLQDRRGGVRESGSQRQQHRSHVPRTVACAFVRRSILIVSASMGAGHDGAAKELRRRLEAAGHRVEVVDFLDAVAFHIGPVLRWFYQVQLRMAPWSYELSYKMAPLLRAPAVMLDTWLTRRKLKRVIKEFRPDAVVSVYPLASLVLGRMRRKKQLRVPVLTYLTDFAVHSLWVHRGIDRHLAVSEISAEAATSRGGRDAFARGPLVSEKFRDATYDRDAVRTNLGLSPDDRAVLVVAGSWGVGDVVATVEAIGRSGEFHPITVCGRDDNLRAELEQRGFGTVIGWTDEMPALMSAADALVENAGGLTCMEAFAVGLPVITFKPIAGHGKDNAEMMARAGVNCYARDEHELATMLRQVTRPGPERDALVHTARRLFVADPADDVEELAQSDHLVDRKGRVVALRAPRGRRTAMIAAASVLVLYGGLTLGAQAVSAIGVGVAKPPKHADHTAYVGVRLDHAQLTDPVLLSQIRDMGVSVVVDAEAASHRSVELEDLADQGVDIANGGMGKGSFLRWNRARNDVAKAGKIIAQEAGAPAKEFCPGRRLDAFDQYWSHKQKQKLVMANYTVRPESLPGDLQAGKVYVLDGRDRDPTAMEVAVADLDAQFESAGLRAAPLGELR